MKKFILGLLFVLGTIVFVSGDTIDVERYKELLAYDEFISGIYHYNKRAYNAAANAFIKSLEQKPEDVRTRIWLGKAYYMAGYERNAINEWERIISYNLGTNLLRQKLNFIYFQRSITKEHKIETDYIPLKTILGIQKNEFTFVHPTSVVKKNPKELYIAGFSSGGIYVFDQNGNIATKIERGEKKLNKPYGIAFDNEENLYITDFGNDSVIIFDKQNKYITSFGGFGLENGLFSGPENIFVDNNNNIYVVDSGNNRIQQFRRNPDFKISFLRSFGNRGSGEGQFFRPVGIAIDKNRKIYVSDLGNKRIQVFDDSGNFVQQFGNEFLKKPRGLLFIDDYNLLVADEELGIVKYNIAHSAWSIVKAKDNEEIFSPVAIDVDKHNLLYVADYGRQNLLVMIPEKLKYVNLDVDIRQTFNRDYPIVTHRIYVADRMNKSIEGLNRSNFKVFEFGKEIESFAVHQFNPNYERMKIVVVNDRNINMKKYNNELKELMDIFLKKLIPSDQIKVLNFGDNFKDMIPYMNQRLKPLEAMTDDKYSEKAEAGRAMYEAVTSSFAADYKSRILLITNGELEDNAFAPYDLEGIMNYAKNNDVPVYVLCFGEGQRIHDLKLLAEKTGGAFIPATSSNDVYRLVDIMRNKKDIFYYLTYTTQAPGAFSKKAWRSLKIEVNYNELFGIDEGGYFIP